MDADIKAEALQKELSRRRNAGLKAFVDRLQKESGRVRALLINAESDLGMNNDILDGNFEELVKTLTNFDRSIQSIRKSIRIQNDSVDEVASSSEEMARTADSITQNIISQSSSLIEFSSVLEEMTASINTVASSTTEAKTLVEKVSRMATEGNSIVNDNINAIEAIRQSSEQITSITSVIQQIAGQSNLLAMNASIEAAHAGELGRGFAVVAEEMRKMAENSSREADKISSIIKEVMDRITAAVESSRKVTVNNDMISSGIGQILEITSQIMGAMQEQSAGTEQVLKEVRSLTDGTTEIKSATEEQISANDSLLNSITRLRAAAEEVNNILEIEEETRNDIVDIINKSGRSYLRNLDIHRKLKGS
jgi:methyl-accepting chemotaxis protein